MAQVEPGQAQRGSAADIARFRSPTHDTSDRSGTIRFDGRVTQREIGPPGGSRGGITSGVLVVADDAGLRDIDDAARPRGALAPAAISARLHPGAGAIARHVCRRPVAPDPVTIIDGATTAHRAVQIDRPPSGILVGRCRGRRAEPRVRGSAPCASHGAITCEPVRELTSAGTSTTHWSGPAYFEQRARRARKPSRDRRRPIGLILGRRRRRFAACHLYARRTLPRASTKAAAPQGFGLTG